MLMASTLENLADSFSLSVFVNAGLSLSDASKALLTARRLIEDAESAAPPAAETLERWAVVVLDTFADNHSRPSLGEHRIPIAIMGQGYAPACYFSALVFGKQIIGPTRDAVRIAAARALSASDPSLPKEPGT
jgi:hypothetical protein